MEEKTAMRVSANSMAVNIVLSVFKLFTGLYAGSGAMVSDAVHSASDVFSTIIVMIGVKMSGKEADEKHQYGHERFECVAAVLLGFFLGFTGLAVGLDGIRRIISPDSGSLAAPKALALAAAVISILVKEAMYRYTKNAALKINSAAVMADAWHHRSDALSSFGSLLGIWGARMGFPVLDSVASIVICVFIIRVSCQIFQDAFCKLIDESCNVETVEQMKQVILNQEGICGLKVIRTRKFGSKIYVDVEICVDGEMKVMEAHSIAEKVHLEVERNFNTVKHCMVAVNPDETERGGIGE